MANAEPAAPQLELIFTARVTVDPPQELGDIGKGRRRIVPITGGTVEGPLLRGATSFETAAARYAWLTKHIIVCAGQREAAAVNLQFYKML